MRELLSVQILPLVVAQTAKDLLVGQVQDRYLHDGSRGCSACHIYTLNSPRKLRLALHETPSPRALKKQFM